MSLVEAEFGILDFRVYLDFKCIKERHRAVDIEHWTNNPLSLGN